MRDEMGILGGVENLQWLFTETLLVMTAVVPLFGWSKFAVPPSDISSLYLSLFHCHVAGLLWPDG